MGKETITSQLRGMGRKESTERLTKVLENTFGFESITNSRNIFQELVFNSNTNNEYKNEKANEIIEKYVILDFLFSSDFIETTKAQNKNLFDTTIFKSILGHLSAEEIIQKYDSIYKIYAKKFNSLMNAEIERISTYTSIQKESRSSWKPFMIKAEKILKLANDNHNVRFIPDQKAERYEKKMMNMLMYMQMSKNIQQKVIEGKNQRTQILAFKKITENLEEMEIEGFQLVVNEMMVEAITQLKLMKLPKKYEIFEHRLMDLQRENFANELKINKLSREADKISLELSEEQRLKDKNKFDLKFNENQRRLLEVSKQLNDLQ